MELYKNGLIIGKLYPIHNGHLHLINSALEKCEKLTVLLCSLPKEMIPGELRFEWLKEIYVNEPKINIVHIKDELQQYPYDDEDDNFWDIWTGIIINALPNIDCIFTSETYGDELKKRINKKYKMNIDSVTVDIHRTTYPISGTDIRNNPYDNWNFIPNNIKPYFMRKVVIIGPESSGKSYTTKALAEHFGVGYADEYGRTYCDMIGNRSLVEEDFYNIANQHAINVKVGMEQQPNKKLFFIDTDYITTQIWGEIYLKKKLDINPKYAYLQYADLYLLMTPDIPWIDDGTREFPELRKWHFDRLENIYTLPYTYKAPHEIKSDVCIIKGNYEERINIAIQTMEKYKKIWKI